MKSATLYSMVFAGCLGLSACAGLYVPVFGVGQDSSGKVSIISGGGGGLLGVGGVGATCGATCYGDPDGEICTKIREDAKKACGIKEARK